MNKFIKSILISFANSNAIEKLILFLVVEIIIEFSIKKKTHYWN